MSLFQAVFDRALDAMVLTDHSDVVVEANPAACELFAAAKDELLGRALGEFTDAERVPRGCGTVRQANGGERSIEYSFAEVLPGLHLWVVRDVTAREEAERRCRLLAYLVDASPDAIVCSNLDGEITSWNPAAQRLFGYDAVEAIGRNVRMLFPPATAQQEYESIRAVIVGGAVLAQREVVRVRKDGTLVDVLLTVTPVRDAGGKIIGAAKIAHDLSVRRQTQEQLRHAQRMEAVGLLAGGVAHDFNNLLSVILSYADASLDEMSESDPHHEPMREIRDAGRRATELTRQLLAFSCKQTSRPRELNLNDCVRGLERMVRRLLGKSIDLQLRLADPLGLVRADLARIEQVVMNLVVNARDAMPSGGELVIETSEVDDDSGARVVLAVRDTGIGMDAATRERAFEAFFTTKDPDHGTGLGLSTVHGIVQQSGGRIAVESELGRGTTFRVELPLSRGTDASATTA